MTKLSDEWKTPKWLDRSKISDEWRTPDYLFDELNAEFGFSFDLCATQENTKLLMFCEDYLTTDLKDFHEQHMFITPLKELVAFMNPPYSNPRPFIEKAYNDAKEHGITIVCLVKCDPSTKWWAVFWDYVEHKPLPGVEVRFLPKRVKFEHPTLKSSSPTFSSAIVIFRGDQM